jgi:LPXTG-motif cell wall-anchored protein
LSRTVFAVILLATAVGPPALADGIRVSPGEASPGQRVHITVPDCGVGPTRHTVTSRAFAHRATLYGKAETGKADPRIKSGLAPGTYGIKAFCGERRTVLGQVVVAGQHRPAAGPAASARRSGSNGPYWALAAVLAVLAGGAGLFALRRRR